MMSTRRRTHDIGATSFALLRDKDRLFTTRAEGLVQKELYLSE